MGLKRKLKERNIILKICWQSAVSYFLVFVIGVLASSFFWYRHLNWELTSVAAQINPLRQQNNTYNFIDPLLGYNIPDNIKPFDEYKPLESKINNLVARQGTVKPDAFGVYFRDLTLGWWTGINENVSFAPGSMMKVIVMIAYFKEAESNPAVLQQILAYSPSVADQLDGIPFETPSNLHVGKSYTVDQLIQSMIINSDNGAKNVLIDNIDSGGLEEIASDLGLPYSDLTKDYANYMISAKQYAIVLRVLFNATYLSREYSEKALGIMSRASYNKGLVAGVPNNIPVAQKFGESVEASDPQSPEITLSNCGIIYHPTHPYILCVMTKGKDPDSLAQIIASISRVTWEEVNK